MKNRTQETFGLTINISVPESVDEFNTLAKAAPGANPCLQAAIDQIVFHDTLGTVRDKFVTLLAGGKVVGVINGENVELDGAKLREQYPKLPTRTVTGQGPKKKDGTTPDVYEKDTIFIKKIKDSGAIPLPELVGILQQVADANPFDPSTSTSSSQIAKKYFNLADSTIAMVKSGEGDWPGFVEQFTEANPGFVFDFEDDGATPTRDSLAAAYKANETREIQAAQSKVMGFVKKSS
jgi:hypothetical protein